MELMQTDLPLPVAPAMSQMRHFGQIGQADAAGNILAERD